MNLVLLLVRVYLLAVIDLDSEIERLVFNFLPFNIALARRGTTRFSSLLLLCCLLRAGGLRGLSLADLRWLALGRHLFLLVFFHFLL
jgi:hypothetical protein